MTGFLGQAYLWVKAAHIVFVIFWMAGLFLFPRYLVHHQESLGTPEATKWVERESKLGRIILGPSIGAVWLLGLALATDGGWWPAGWLHAKLLLVLLLSGYQGWMIAYSKRLARGEGRIESRTLRMLGEVPALAVILIVVLVVVKPF